LSCVEGDCSVPLSCRNGNQTTLGLHPGKQLDLHRSNETCWPLELRVYTSLNQDRQVENPVIHGKRWWPRKYPPRIAVGSEHVVPPDIAASVVGYPHERPDQRIACPYPMQHQRKDYLSLLLVETPCRIPRDANWITMVYHCLGVVLLWSSVLP
jgi:hypothetical protein